MKWPIASCRATGASPRDEAREGTDGTEGGTLRLADINTSGSSNPSLLGTLDGIVVLRADDGVNATEPWITDGTAGGTTLLADINPSGASAPEALGVFDGELLFVADDGVTGRELWVTDGTTAGTALLTDICSGGCSGMPAPAD